MRMYGPEYGLNTSGATSVDPKDPTAVIASLAGSKPGIFVDFGCGDGKLLMAARDAGWQCCGIELNPDTANQTCTRTKIPVYTELSALPQGLADALHLGDVIEHLTEVETQFPAILSLLKPGGCLIAQGPLENNANLFTAMVRLVHRTRGHAVDSLPYHVLLATSSGQRIFFERFHLRPVRFTITEEHWPAPAEPFSSPRAATLFFLRRVSQFLTRLVGRNWGNRYFYVGATSSR